jgi:hypothetical protein
MYEIPTQSADHLLELRDSWPFAGRLNGYTVALHAHLLLYSSVCEQPGRKYSRLPAYR